MSCSKTQRAFESAVRFNDLRHLKALLFIKKLRYRENNNKGSLLFQAVCQNSGGSHLDMLKLLLSEIVKKKDKDDPYPLRRDSIFFILVKSASVKVVELFVDHGADLTQLNKYGETLLFEVARENTSCKVLKFFLAHTDIAHRSACGQTVLHSVAKANTGNSHYKIIFLLLKRGADVNAEDDFGLTPLVYLCKYASLSVVSLMVSYGADVHVSCLCGNSMLTLACKFDAEINLISFFLDHGLNANAQNYKGRTPIFYATKNNNRELSNILLRVGATRDDDENKTADRHTKRKGHCCKDEKVEYHNTLYGSIL